jgi:rhodanese-related sulfurtransferase
MTYTTKFQSMADIAMSRVEGISPQDVDRLLSDGAIALNIRDREEHDVGHIDGSLNISRGKLEMNVEEQIADLNTVILCYCNANNRGALSAAALCSMGYVNAKYIAGGLKAYRASKIYRSAKIRFLDIADLRKMNS